MRKIALLALMAAFAASSFAIISAPASAKDQPGKCGTLKYFSKKDKKCVSAVK
jgi:hypothetical protein